MDLRAASLEIPAAFTARKQKILSELQQPDDEYTDKSPKGTVDVQIRDLIDEINGLEGYVTTSSCAGRVAVFVEGGDTASNGPSEDSSAGRGPDRGASDDMQGAEPVLPSTRTSPGGKGGGHWLYVSHDPLSDVTSHDSEANRQVDGSKNPGEHRFTHLFGLSPSSHPTAQEELDQFDDGANATTSLPRLVHLSFSPLILHINCATLQHARPLLAAAINAGFRESGVQSLRALEDPTVGVMLAIRTAGLAFETVVGTVEGEHGLKKIVSEEYLAMCARVVNQRFKWNDERRERLRAEIRRVGDQQLLASAWEDESLRRARKRREGLLRQQQQKRVASVEREHDLNDHDQTGLEDGLVGLDMG